MIVDTALKNISEEDLKAWSKYSSLGSVGVTFFSESWGTVDSSLLEFFLKCGSTVDSFVILTPEKALTEEDIKIVTLLPYVHFVYCKENPSEFIETIGCNYFFKTKDQQLPASLEKAISSLEECNIQEF